MRSSVVHRRLLAGLILFAFALRVYRIDQFSFWLDEALTPLRAGYALEQIVRNVVVIQGFSSQDTHPPFYYLLIHVTQALFGGSDFALRYPSALFGVLLVPVVEWLGRRMFDGRTALLAALFVAVNPQQVWYAQEARMYTLLVLLLALASGVLWATWQAPPPTLASWARRLLLYALPAGLALYTHYTAAFLILGQAVLWGWLLWRAGRHRLIIGGLLLALMVALPLVPIVVPRLLGPDETSYFPVAPVVLLQDVVRGFGLGRTVEFGTPLIQLIAVLLAVLALLGLARAGRARVAFLLVYLLAVVFGLMVGSTLFKPMYLGPHHIMAGSPAFILLLAAGCFALPRPRWSALPAAGVVLLAAGLALNNLYHDPAYAKEDYRALIGWIEQHAGANDLVLYNNAILLTMHAHYAQRSDLVVTALPVYPYRAKAETAAEVAAAIAPYDRVWFIPELPPDGRDDDGIVAQALAEAGVPLNETAFHGRFGVVNVVTVALAAGQTALPAAAAGAEGAVRGSLVEPIVGAVVWVDLFWNGAALRDEPAAGVLLELRDPAGRAWSTTALPRMAQRVALPDVALPDTPLVRLSYALPLPAGMPPGDYTLWQADQDLAQDGPRGTWQQLATLPLTPPLSDVPFERAAVRFANGVELLGVQWADDATRPGNPLPGTLYWRMTEPLPADPQLTYELIVTGRDGELRRDRGPLGAAWLAAEALPVGVPLAQPIGVYPRPETAPGDYAVRVRLLNAETGEPVWAAPGWWPLPTGWQQTGNGVRAALLRVVAWPRVATLPADVTPLAQPVRYGDGIELAAYELVRRDQTIDVTLYWRSLVDAPPALDVFLHLSAAADAPPAAQSNGVPVGGARPTVGWRAGEIVTDRRSISLNSDLAAGEYGLYIGLYAPESGVRPPAVQDGTRLPNDQVLLEAVNVP